jgi:hypothetical protein
VDCPKASKQEPLNPAGEEANERATESATDRNPLLTSLVLDFDLEPAQVADNPLAVFAEIRHAVLER